MLGIGKILLLIMIYDLIVKEKTFRVHFQPHAEVLAHPKAPGMAHTASAEWGDRATLSTSRETGPKPHGSAPCGRWRPYAPRLGDYSLWMVGAYFSRPIYSVSFPLPPLPFARLRPDSFKASPKAKRGETEKAKASEVKSSEKPPWVSPLCEGRESSVLGSSRPRRWSRSDSRAARRRR